MENHLAQDKGQSYQDRNGAHTPPPVTKNAKLGYCPAHIPSHPSVNFKWTL
jgi:hypothetical protein